MNDTRWHLVSWKLRDRNFKDVVFIQAKLDDGNLITRNPYVVLDAARKLDHSGPLPWMCKLTARDATYIERMVVALEERAQLYPLADKCCQCSRVFDACTCDTIEQDWSVA